MSSSKALCGKVRCATNLLWLCLYQDDEKFKGLASFHICVFYRMRIFLFGHGTYSKQSELSQLSIGWVNIDIKVY